MSRIEPDAKANLFLFCASPLEIGWSADQISRDNISSEIELLENAMVVDFAERCAEKEGVNVIIHETEKTNVDADPPMNPGIIRHMQMEQDLEHRVRVAVKSAYEADESATLVVFHRISPLYPPAYIDMAVDLLQQENETVVFGESIQNSGIHAILFVATKSYSPSLHSSPVHSPASVESLFQSIVDTQALLLPMPSMPLIVELEALGPFLHEIERQILLNRWYPVRTHGVLRRMQRKGIFPRAA